jgi:hypothetical protein
MTRTTDDLQDAERFQPLGAPIRKPAPPAEEARDRAWRVPGPDGRLYTDQPLPKEKP